MLFSKEAAPIYIPTNSARGFPFSTSSPLIVVISCLCLSLIKAFIYKYLKWHLGATEIIQVGHKCHLLPYGIIFTGSKGQDGDISLRGSTIQPTTPSHSRHISMAIVPSQG